MAVNEGVEDLSTTAASNTPSGSDNIGTDLDDHLRDIKKNLRTVAQMHKSSTAPSHFAGRIWYNTSATATDNLLTLNISDGAAWIKLATVNISANTAYSPASPGEFASAATTLTAGNGLSGGGTLAANRSFSLANTGLTATTTYTNTTVILDPFGRVVSAESGTRPSGPSSASQVEDRSGSATYVSPSHLHHHLGVAKFWVAFDGSGTASVTQSYNVSSVVRSAAGVYTINFSTGFANTGYIVIGSGLGVSGTNRIFNPRALAAGSCQVAISNASAAAADGDKVYVAGFGYFVT